MTISLDKQTRDAIAMEAGKAVREAMEIYDEKWLSAEQLCEHISMFTKDWLKHYGHTIPRDRLEVVDIDGTVRCSRWAYPLHRIQRMLKNQELKHLKISGSYIQS